MQRKTTAAVALGVLIVVVVLRSQFLAVSQVSSDSMAPTVCAGDIVLTARLSGGSGVDVGEIVTFPSPQDGTVLIKRVVAVGGQRVAIADAQLMVDGVRVAEPYVDHASIDGVYFGPVTVPDGSVFVLGDHREISIDSRVFGAIQRAEITGRLLWDIWSGCESSGDAESATP